jgi:hypothetical protein
MNSPAGQVISQRGPERGQTAPGRARLGSPRIWAERHPAADPLVAAQSRGPLCLLKPRRLPKTLHIRYGNSRTPRKRGRRCACAPNTTTRCSAHRHQPDMRRPRFTAECPYHGFGNLQRASYLPATAEVPTHPQHQRSPVPLFQPSSATSSSVGTSLRDTATLSHPTFHTAPQPHSCLPAAPSETFQCHHMLVRQSQQSGRCPCPGLNDVRAPPQNLTSKSTSAWSLTLPMPNSPTSGKIDDMSLRGGAWAAPRKCYVCLRRQVRKVTRH